MSSHGFHRLGLLYAAIPVLAAAHDGYEVSTQASKQHHPIDLVTIFMPRLVLGLILAFVVYGFFRAIGSILMRLHGVALAAQPTWQFITSKQSARRLSWWPHLLREERVDQL